MKLSKAFAAAFFLCPSEVLAASYAALSADATCSDDDSACALNALQSERKILSKRGSSHSESTWPQKNLGNTFDATPEGIMKVMKYQPGGADKESPTGEVLFPGIYWMDQYGSTQEHFGEEGMPPKDYPYYFPTSSPEVLFTTEGAHWVGDGTITPGTSPCLYPLAGGGVDEDATWTYVNMNGKGWNFYWPILNPPPKGWFAGEGPEPPPPPFNGYGLYFCPVNATNVNIPLGTTLSTAQFSKQSWGWDRITAIPPLQQLGFLGSIFGWIGGLLQVVFWPASWGILPIPNYAREQHYPVYQIIDGEGKTTPHFQYFKEFIDKKKSCFGKPWPLQPSWIPSFFVPLILGNRNYCNDGPGTMVYATNATWNESSSWFFR